MGTRRCHVIGALLIGRGLVHLAVLPGHRWDLVGTAVLAVVGLTLLTIARVSAYLPPGGVGLAVAARVVLGGLR